MCRVPDRDDKMVPIHRCRGGKSGNSDETTQDDFVFELSREEFMNYLSEDLELDGVPRSPGVSGRRGLTSDAEEELTAWMRAHLRLSWWEAPEGVDAAEVAAAVTRELSPALHSTGVDRPWDRLTESRRAIVQRARRSATL